MQEQNQIFSDFLRRTDLLAEKLNLRLIDLPEKIGISKAMLFAYRKGTNPISAKAWIRLEQAERAAGISPPFQEQLKTVLAPAARTRLIESASYQEMFRSLPPEVQQMMQEGTLHAINVKIIDYLNLADELTHLVDEMIKKPSNKEVRESVMAVSRQITNDYRPTRQLWEKVYKSLLKKWEH